MQQLNCCKIALVNWLPISKQIAAKVPVDKSFYKIVVKIHKIALKIRFAEFVAIKSWE